MAQVSISIPYPYNPGECRVSKLVIGPRGGKRWEKVFSTPATGGEYQTSLEPGRYRKTWWSNGFPRSTTFDVSEGE